MANRKISKSTKSTTVAFSNPYTTYDMEAPAVDNGTAIVTGTESVIAAAKGIDRSWGRQKAALAVLNKMVGRRWDVSNKNAAAPEYYWVVNGKQGDPLSDEKGILAVGKGLIAKCVRADGKSLRIGNGTGNLDQIDVSLFFETADGCRRLVYAY